MAAFPTLKTGAVMQYPATRAARSRNQVLRYVDGAEQRYREYAAPLKEWIIRLDLLDESEVAALEEFFQSEKGQYGSFTFTDQADGAQYPNCSLEEDEFAFELRGEMRSRTTLTVRENRG